MVLSVKIKIFIIQHENSYLDSKLEFCSHDIHLLCAISTPESSLGERGSLTYHSLDVNE